MEEERREYGQLKGRAKIWRGEQEICKFYDPRLVGFLLLIGLGLGGWKFGQVFSHFVANGGANYGGKVAKFLVTEVRFL